MSVTEGDRLGKVMHEIKTAPGVNRQQIHDRCGVSLTAVERILAQLVREGAVVRDQRGKRQRYFPKNVGRTKRERDLMAFLNRPRARRILEELAKRPATNRELADRFDLDPPAVAYWMGHFEKSGIVEALDPGRAPRYRVVEPSRLRAARKTVNRRRVIRPGRS